MSPASERTRLMSREEKPLPPSTSFAMPAATRRSSERARPSCETMIRAWPRSGLSTTTILRSLGVTSGGATTVAGGSPACQLPNASRTRRSKSACSTSPAANTMALLATKLLAWNARACSASSAATATGETMTYAELDETANRLSRAFSEAGLQPGDHLAFCMENRLEYLPILWGAHYAGLNYTTVSSRLTAEELGYIIEDSGSRAFLSSPYKADAIAQLERGDTLARLDLRIAVGGALDGFDDYEDVLAANKSEPLATRLEGQPMLYSSGTTGRPKGVKMPFVEKPLGTPEGLTMLLVGILGANDQTVYLSPAPLYHSAPLRYCTNIQRLGGTVVVMDKFDAEAALANIEKYAVTHSQWVPTMFVRMLKLPEEVRNVVTTFPVSLVRGPRRRTVSNSRSKSR